MGLSWRSAPYSRAQSCGERHAGSKGLATLACWCRCAAAATAAALPLPLPLPHHRWFSLSFIYIELQNHVFITCLVASAPVPPSEPVRLSTPARRRPTSPARAREPMQARAPGPAGARSITPPAAMRNHCGRAPGKPALFSPVPPDRFSRLPLLGRRPSRRLRRRTAGRCRAARRLLVAAGPAGSRTRRFNPLATTAGRRDS